MDISFRRFLEQMPGPQMGGPPMGGPPGPPAAGPPGQMPDWNNLAYELGIEPEDLKNQTFVGSWTGPSLGNLSNLRAFTVQAVDHEGEKIKGMQIDFLPTSSGGSKGLRDMAKVGGKWRIVPKGARITKKIPQFVDFDWFNKLIFQDKSGGGQPGTPGGLGALPGPGGLPQMNPMG